MRFRFVGQLANNLDNNVVEGGLGIDIEDADFAVLEAKLFDLFADRL